MLKALRIEDQNMTFSNLNTDNRHSYINMFVVRGSLMCQRFFWKNNRGRVAGKITGEGWLINIRRNKGKTTRKMFHLYLFSFLVTMYSLIISKYHLIYNLFPVFNFLQKK